MMTSCSIGKSSNSWGYWQGVGGKVANCRAFFVLQLAWDIGSPGLAPKSFGALKSQPSLAWLSLTHCSFGCFGIVTTQQWDCSLRQQAIHKTGLPCWNNAVRAQVHVWAKAAMGVHFPLSGLEADN
jgi:hypothetical protein